MGRVPKHSRFPINTRGRVPKQSRFPLHTHSVYFFYTGMFVTKESSLSCRVLSLGSRRGGARLLKLSS